MEETLPEQKIIKLKKYFCCKVILIENLLVLRLSPVEVVNVVWLVVAPAPRQEDELAVGVEVVVELDGVLLCRIIE